ncbi:hypothetical protein [Azospirillum sp. SYSU D00513]|uniref:hypothetical protein n=1 Tax=Azospirillum sp. SYSU D00513 TaxID=2812561 RepID=UPI001A96C0D9|nr:hypothetical protein [Azospirillum sp. SYSU D00513]
MRKTIVALYDSAAQAEAARQSLLAAGFDETDLDLHSDGGFGGSMDGHGAVVATMIGWGMPEAEAHQYAEGLRRGGTLLTASLASDEAVSRATGILEPTGRVDLSERSAQWRNDTMTDTSTGSGLAGAAASMRDANAAPHVDQTQSAQNQSAPFPATRTEKAGAPMEGPLAEDIDRADRGTLDRGRLP